MTREEVGKVLVGLATFFFAALLVFLVVIGFAGH